MRAITKTEYERYLNDLGMPQGELAREDGRIRSNCRRYGSWLRTNDPIAFNVGYREYVDEMEYVEGTRST